MFPCASAPTPRGRLKSLLADAARHRPGEDAALHAKLAREPRLDVLKVVEALQLLVRSGVGHEQLSVDTNAEGRRLDLPVQLDPLLRLLDPVRV